MLSLNSYKGFDFITCYNRLIDSSPCCYIDSCNVVSMTREATLNTSKCIPVWSIPSFIMPTYRANMRSSSWIHKYNRYSRKSSFVLNETSQLIECPRMVAASLSLSNRCTGSDTCEVFKSNSFASVFCFSHNLLGNYVINVTMKPSLLAREFLEMSLSGFSPCTLEVDKKSRISFPNLINLFPTECFSITVSCEINNPQINTDSSNSIEFRRFWNINNNCKIEYSISIDKVCLTSDSIHSNLLILTDADRDNLPFVNRQDRYSFKLSPRKNTLVIDYSTIGSKFRFYSSIPFICFRYFSDSSNGQLGRKVKLIANTIINDFLKLNLISGFSFKSNIGNVVACFVKLMHSFQKSCMLFFRSIKFNHKCLQHSINGSTQWFCSIWSLGGVVVNYHPTCWMASCFIVSLLRPLWQASISTVPTVLRLVPISVRLYMVPGRERIAFQDSLMPVG